jgi:NAD(P)-dependent dehydrogenase (short-subunit alcohol dehydrogenase family)
MNAAAADAATDVAGQGRPMAVVSGASSGIGHAVAARLLDEGWRVVGLSRTHGQAPAEATWLSCDLSDPSSVEEAVEHIRVAVPGRVNALVHAAGLQHSGALGSLDRVGGNRMWAIHVRAAELLADGLVDDIVDGGRIILIGSRTMTGIAGKSQYAATKAALAALARSWAADLASRQITVNVVAPGPTRTAMLGDPRRASVPPRIPPLGRLIEPDEVARLVSFLLSSGGAMITGQSLVMCGGASLPTS